MAEYYYDAEDEAFKREDKRGNHLSINIVEAQRIVQMVDMGVSNFKIKKEVDISNPKCGKTTVDSFIKNYKQGNIHMPDDAPVPVHVFESIQKEDRMDSIEERIEKLENDLEEFKRRYLTPKSKLDKVKSWIK